ncbi:MAG: hypothetical protein LBC51_08815 [Treponema sp.]|nr:hypothetical protein [Treponema sp.]
MAEESTGKANTPPVKDGENDLVTEVSTLEETLRNQGILVKIVQARLELLRLETIKNILAVWDETLRIQDWCMRAALRISGYRIGTVQPFDPAGQRITVDLSPARDLRGLEQPVKVHILGEKHPGAYTGLVTNTATGKTQGTITVDEDHPLELTLTEHTLRKLSSRLLHMALVPKP